MLKIERVVEGWLQTSLEKDPSLKETLESHKENMSKVLEDMANLYGCPKSAIDILFAIGETSTHRAIDAYAESFKKVNAMTGSTATSLRESLNDKANREMLVEHSKVDRIRLWKSLGYTANMIDAVEAYLGSVFTEKDVQECLPK